MYTGMLPCLVPSWPQAIQLRISFRSRSVGHTPSQYGRAEKKIWKNSGKTPETLLERFLEFPSRVRLGCPKAYNSRHLRLPEHFQNSLPPSTAGDASFFRSGSGEGLSEPVMEFPAVLGVSLILTSFWMLAMPCLFYPISLFRRACRFKVFFRHKWRLGL